LPVDSLNVKYDQTTAEQAASVTPSTLGYAVDVTDYTNVMRYVTNNVDGVNSQAAAFQAAINVAKKGGGDVIVPAPPYVGGAYVIDAGLNCSTLPGQTNQPFAIRGSGKNAAFTSNSPYRPSVVLKMLGNAFDFTGTLNVDIQDLAITTDPTTFPTLCFLLARNSDKNSATAYFRNVRIIGEFSDAIEGNCGVEQISREACKYWNNLATGPTKVVRLSANNVAAYASAFSTIASGSAESTSVQRFIGCDLQSASTNALADLVYLEAAADVSFTDTWSYMAGGRAMIYQDGTNNVTPRVIVRGWKCESISAQAYFADISNNTNAAPVSGWKFDNLAFFGTSNWLHVEGPLPVLDEFSVSQIIESGNSGIVIPGTLQNSADIAYDGSLTIGNSSGNRLIGNPAHWVITTRTADKWYDWTAGALAWTPITSALALGGGTLVVSNKRLQYDGSTITVTCSLVNTGGTLSCAAGTLLGGLPAPPSANSADVTITNTATSVGIPGGSINGTSIVLPALSVPSTNPLIITARYFAA